MIGARADLERVGGCSEMEYLLPEVHACVALFQDLVMQQGGAGGLLDSLENGSVTDLV